MTMAVETPAQTTQPALEASRQFCQDLTRTHAGNFYYGLRLLPEEKRMAMYALYAYMRMVDDIADQALTVSVDARLAQLEQWRQKTHAVVANPDGALAPTDSPMWRAFAKCVEEYHIPMPLFDDMIAGQRQDLNPLAFKNFTELHDYCYRVASVVGLASIYIWGFAGGAATERLAIDRGVAFQLTNVLRDMQEDAQRGRCYLPAEELQQFGVRPQDILEGRVSEQFVEFVRWQVQRAEDYYQRSALLEQRVSPDSRPTLLAMTQIYHGILAKIRRRPASVLQGRVSLGGFTKLGIAWRAWAGH